MGRKRAKLVSFKACVVEVETYNSNGKKLYHAVLDSMPKEPKRQAQFFGLEENLFKPGEVHVVTFSRAVARVKGDVKASSEAEIQAQRVRQAHAFKKAMEEYEKSDLIN